DVRSAPVMASNVAVADGSDRLISIKPFAGAVSYWTTLCAAAGSARHNPTSGTITRMAGSPVARQIEPTVRRFDCPRNMGRWNRVGGSARYRRTGAPHLSAAAACFATSGGVA